MFARTGGVLATDFHLMDRPRPMAAAGLPFAFRYAPGGRTETGVPGARTPFTPVSLEIPAPCRWCQVVNM
ncbi:hypothetical protein [Actinomadura monticuli]|uniref:Uncharacterized protein n=1 Tax=Actinomadura monticuli TaxID=3097367 RepID=A0ABV4Q7L8_9ACTN